MAPTRRREQIIEAVLETEALLHLVPCHGDIFMGRDPQRVEGAQILDDTIPHRLAFFFRNKGAEQPVPDDKDAGIIGIKIARVASVMDPVMGRCVEHRLNPGMEFAHSFSVDEELIDQVHRAGKSDHARVKTQQNKGDREDEKALGETEPGLAQRGREIVMLAGVMNDVVGPAPSDSVAEAVTPVITQVIKQKAGKKRPDGELPFDRRELIEPEQHAIDHSDKEPTNQSRHDHAAKAHQYAGRRIAGFVNPLGASHGNQRDLQQDESHIDRCGIISDWRKSGISGMFCCSLGPFKHPGPAAGVFF